MFCIIFMIVFRQLLLIFFGVKVTLLLGLKVQLSQKLIIMIFHSFHQPRYTMCHIQICMVIFVEFQLFEVVEVSFMTFLQYSYGTLIVLFRTSLGPFHEDLVIRTSSQEFSFFRTISFGLFQPSSQNIILGGFLGNSSLARNCENGHLNVLQFCNQD